MILTDSFKWGLHKYIWGKKERDIQSRETESFLSHIQVTHSTSMCSVAYRASTKSLQIALFWDEDDTNILYLF